MTVSHPRGQPTPGVTLSSALRLSSEKTEKAAEGLGLPSGLGNSGDITQHTYRQQLK